MTHVWTYLTVLIFAFMGLSGLLASKIQKKSAGRRERAITWLSAMQEILLAVSLGVVAWMETEWGALLVIIVGFIMFSEASSLQP